MHRKESLSKNLFAAFIDEAPKQEAVEAADQFLKRFGLFDKRVEYPTTLSGGSRA